MSPTEESLALLLKLLGAQIWDQLFFDICCVYVGVKCEGKFFHTVMVTYFLAFFFFLLIPCLNVLLYISQGFLCIMNTIDDIL